MDQKTLFIAIGGGIAFAIMTYIGQALGVAGIPFAILATLPIYCSALAGGTRAAIASALIAFAATALLLSAQGALFAALASSIPAAIIGHQANLAQPSEDGSLEWYPLSWLFFNLAMTVSIGILAIALFLTTSNPELVSQVQTDLQKLLAENYSQLNLTQAELAAFASQIINMLPFGFASLWLIAHVVTLIFASHICRSRNLLPRPKDDLQKHVNLPLFAVLIVAAGLLGTVMLDGSARFVSAVFAGAFLTAFSLVGLAGLHLRLRNNPAAFLVLSIVYLTIFLITLPLYLFAIGGLMRSLYQPTTSNPPNSG